MMCTFIVGCNLTSKLLAGNACLDSDKPSLRTHTRILTVFNPLLDIRLPQIFPSSSVIHLIPATFFISSLHLIGGHLVVFLVAQTSYSGIPDI